MELIFAKPGVSFVGNMGKKALKSHAAGLKHKMKENCLLRAKQEQKPLRAFLTSSSGGKGCSDSLTAQSPELSNEVHASEATTSQLVVPPPPQTATNTLPQSIGATGTHSNTGLSAFVMKDAVLEAEILWAIKTVMDHYSCSSSDNSSNLFQRMFPDSQIVKQFSCGRTKCSYLVKYGLAPYFHQKVLDVVTQPECLFAVSFDESFNKVIQQEQMDLLLRYWDDDKREVITRYFGSEFLGHNRADDLKDKFTQGLESLNQKNMIQISMDGPSVNLKFYDEVVKHREETELGIPQLIYLGSCSLHVVHGAFKTGAQATTWNIDSLLRALHYLFHNSPARTEDYVKLTDSTQLPLKFCSTRWLEDTPVAERAMLIWPKIVKYVQETVKGPRSKVPKIQSFTTIQNSTKDPLTTAKLQFFATQARVLEPYLEKYQTGMPMAVFMAEDLEDILCSQVD